MDNKHKEIDALLKGLFEEDLRHLFDKRLHELNITQTSVQNILGIERRTLNGILDGTQKKANFSAFNKLSLFLNIPTERLIEIHISQLEKNCVQVQSSTKKKNFIRENFDLVVLKKAGVIEDLTDFEAIENKIVSFFGINSISEYKKRTFDAAFSAGAIVPKNTATREFWLTSAKIVATKLDNPYYYSREELIKYFPQIRWHSTNVDTGLVNVIKTLFKLGVTVVYLPPMSNLHLRGATFAVSGQPCIALTDYKGFYPTLWHCLIHELYHVLFDWEEIKNDMYHVSEDSGEVLSNDAKEAEVNDFAREYFFSKSKLQEVAPYLRDYDYISEVAKDNNIDPSIIYVYHAFDNGSIDRKAWARARRETPNVKRAIYKIEVPFSKPIEETVNKLKIEVYN
jgi:Zn-dependent peptidase ImmA (M78 family)